MEKFTFENIASFLRSGREVEFAYNGKQYSITNRNGMWYLCCDTDNFMLSELCEYQAFDALVAKVSSFTLYNSTIADVFNHCLYETGSVCIL